MEKHIIVLVVLMVLTWCSMTGLLLYTMSLGDKIRDIDERVITLQKQSFDQKEKLGDIEDELSKAEEKTNNSGSDSAMETARKKARDARRMSDMRQLVSGQEMYYGENDTYLTSPEYPDAIGEYLTKTPMDPLGFEYGSVGNVNKGQQFCYYAKFEIPNTTATGCTQTPCAYYTASEGGNFYRATPPTTLGTDPATGCAPQI